MAEKKGEAEAIAASRVQDGVLPAFNQEVDSNFAQQGDKLNRELYSGLRNAGIFPDTFTYQSTDQMLTMNARLMAPHQIGADLPESRLLTATGITALVHETAVNNGIDKMGIAGQTLNEDQLKAKIESFLSTVLNRPYRLAAPPKTADAADDEVQELNAIIFAPVDPIRVRVTDGQVVIIIRAGFKKEGDEDIPMREITVPISLSAQGGKIFAKADNVIVTAAEGEGGGVAINAVVRKKIQSLLPDRVLDGKIEIQTPTKIVVAYVTQLTLVDGWISAGIN